MGPAFLSGGVDAHARHIRQWLGAGMLALTGVGACMQATPPDTHPMEHVELTTMNAQPPRVGTGGNSFAPQFLTRQQSDAIGRIEGQVHADVALETTPNADGLHLQPGTETFFQRAPGLAKGTVVMYHGFTAGPWQYKEMAQRFHAAGYNVYVPRMPGHGMAQASGMPTGKDIPDANHRDEWVKFIDTTVQNAAGLGAPVYTVGLSGGADVALAAAERYPQVKGVAAMSPYLGGNAPTGVIFPAFDDLDKWTHGGLGEVLDHVPFQGNKIVPNDPMPHTEGTLGQALVMQELGQNIRHISVPVQILSSDGDYLSGSDNDARLLQKAGGADQSGWYRFHQDEHVPHAMLSPQENKAPGAAQKVSDIVFDFIVHGQTTQRQ
ncbi:MAG TPA: alpha/beta fold hydrolase [Candidatus Xenobia bacterium]